jgi:hypothetical protein
LAVGASICDPAVHVTGESLELDKLGQFFDSRRQIDGLAAEMNLKCLIFLGLFGADHRIRNEDLLIEL